MESESSQFNNILLIHFGQLGDVVLGLAAMRALRQRYPHARITAVTGLAAGEVVRLSGFVDEVIKVDRVEMRDGPKLRSIGKIFRFARDMRSRDFDLVVDLHSLKETNILAWFTRAKHRLLANRGNRSFHSLGNFDPPPPAEDRSLHLSRTYMRVLGPLGVDAEPEPVVVEPSDADSEVARERLKAAARPIAAFFPGAGNPSRCWPLENFATLAARLSDDGYSAVVFLGPEEREILRDVTEAFPAGTVIIDGLNLGQFIAAVAQAAVFVSNDTGPVHLAALAGVPIVLVVDERAPSTFLPLAQSLKVVDPAEIDRIPVDDVHLATRELLGMTNPRAAC